MAEQRTYTAEDVTKLTGLFVKLADPKKFDSRRGVMKEMLTKPEAKEFDLDALAYLFNARVMKRLNAGKSVPGVHPNFAQKWTEIMQVHNREDAPVTPQVTTAPANGTTEVAAKVQNLLSECASWKVRAETAESELKKVQEILATASVGV